MSLLKLYTVFQPNFHKFQPKQTFSGIDNRDLKWYNASAFETLFIINIISPFSSAEAYLQRQKGQAYFYEYEALHTCFIRFTQIRSRSVRICQHHGGRRSDSCQCRRTLFPISVSYTHLDVYKRQTVDFHARKNDHIRIRSIVFVIINPVIGKGHKIVTLLLVQANHLFWRPPSVGARCVAVQGPLQPVSYTHLDVYKRQG